MTTAWPGYGSPMASSKNGAGAKISSRSGSVQIRPAADEPVRLADVGREHAPAPGEVVDQLLAASPRRPGCRRATSKPSGTTRWSSRFAPTSGDVVDRIDAVLGELVAVTDARQHQQLRRVDRAGAQQHLASRPDHLAPAAGVDFDADGAAAVEQHPGHGGLGEQLQVLPAQRRLEVGVGGAPPRSPALRHQRLAEALPATPDSASRPDDPAPRPRRSQVAVELRGLRCGDTTSGPLSISLEVLLDAGEGPVRACPLAPLVVVGGEPTHPHHGVHRRRAAERLAAWPVDLAAVELLLRLGQVVPVHRAAEQLGEGGRDVNELVLVARPGLHDRHPHARHGAESVGQHRAGRAACPTTT